MRWNAFILALAVLPLFSSAQTKAPVECRSQSQIDVSTIKPQIILIGERHGTEQAPAFVSGLICSLVKNGRSVILALEIGSGDQPALNTYIDSEGSAADREALLSQGTWTWAADGRTSRAMLALIDDIRVLRRADQRVGLLAMNIGMGFKVPQRQDELKPLTPEETRRYSSIEERARADKLAVMAMLYRGYTIVVLAGGTHTSTKPYSPDPLLIPMGQLLAGMEPVFSIILKSSEGGEVWQHGKVLPQEPGTIQVTGTQDDAEVELGQLTASPPAKSYSSAR